MGVMKAIAAFGPVIAGWFAEKFGEPTDVQKQAWAAITAGEHTLICAPTGSGKTLAALLPCLDRIIKDKLSATSSKVYEPGVRVLYITPLKALNNDIHEHLFDFTAEMSQLAEEREAPWPGIRVGVRTGDTGQSTRAAMLRKPPDLLVTTPESFYLLMTSVKGREMLKRVEQVIVDEIHSMASDPRGVHLSVTLERLAAWSGRTIQRIGVSATQRPLVRVARFLGGWQPAGSVTENEAEIVIQSGKPISQQEEADLFADHMKGWAVRLSGEREQRFIPRPVVIVESAMERQVSIQVVAAERNLTIGRREDVWKPLVEQIFRVMEGAASTVIFVNNRRLCERLTLHMNEQAGYEISRSHHGSVAKEKRLEVERMLREGQLRCLVATASLELGIDIGHVDLVLQIDPPPSAASGIQRIGRAGHAVGGISRGVLLARSRSALPELAVLSSKIANKEIEEIQIPRHVLGVLSQQVTAMVAMDDYAPEQLYRLVLGSDCYRGFSYDSFCSMLDVLSGLYPFAKPLIQWNREQGLISRLKQTGFAALTGAGTIPQTSNYPVVHAGTQTQLGEVDEEFIFESRAGDVFQLGTSSWRIQSIRADKVLVTESAGRGGSEIPFWRGEGLGRTYETGEAVGSLVRELESLLLLEEGTRNERKSEAVEWVLAHYPLTASSAEDLVSWVQSQRAVCGLPTDKQIVVEQFVDEGGQTHLIIHSWFGRKLNRTWLMVLQLYLEDRIPQAPIHTVAKDNGIELIYKQWDDTWLPIMLGLRSEQVEPLLREAVPISPLFAAMFRQSAEMSLLIRKGFTRRPAWMRRLRSEELLRQALPYADKFPIIGDAIRSSLYEHLDAYRLGRLLASIEQEAIVFDVHKGQVPSPFALQFSFDFVNQAMYESDALSKDIQLQMLSVSRQMAEDTFGRKAVEALFDQQTLAEAERAYVTPDPERMEQAEGLYRLLKEQGDRTTEELQALLTDHPVQAWLGELNEANRIIEIQVAGEQRWICKDEYGIYEGFPVLKESIHFVLRRFIGTRMAFTQADLVQRYAMKEPQVEQQLRQWAAEGLIVTPPFAEVNETGYLWMTAALADQVVRYSVRRMRSRQDQVPQTAYCAKLLEEHGLTPSTQRSGIDGLRAVIAQLQGIYLPLSSWETILLPSRLKQYRKEELDQLCASGEVFWLGHKGDDDKEGKIAFFLYESLGLYRPRVEWAAKAMDSLEAHTEHPELLRIMMRKGACFLTALSSETGLPPSELMLKLMDLVWEGWISNDQFAPLRLHGKGTSVSADKSKFRSGLGRWFVVTTLPGEGAEESTTCLPWVTHLLDLNGIVSKATASVTPYSWDTLAGALRQLEDWGMVTRGLHVQHVGGLQFARPEWLSQLQSATPARSLQSEITIVSASDPANPYGRLLEWPEAAKGTVFSRKPGNFLIYWRGQWVMWVENKGRKIVWMVQESAGQITQEQMEVCWRETVRAVVRLLQLKKLVVETWNGEIATQPQAAELLLRTGAEKDQNRMVYWLSSLR